MRTSLLLLVFLVALGGCVQTFDGLLGDDDDSTFAADDDDASGDDDDASGDDDDATSPLDPCDETLGPDSVPSDPDCLGINAYSEFSPNQDIEWQWAGGAVEASYDHVINAPVVINLTDDDGDGDIDADDVPDVVFYSYDDGAFSDANTRAISGADGTPLWTHTANRARPRGHIAAGELDPASPGPELVIVTQSDEVVLLSAGGSELWATAHPDGLARAAPAIHDMNGDGSPEIIVGRAVFSSGGSLLGVGDAGKGANQDRGQMSFAVDIDDDGELEVIVGNAAYDMTGGTEWANGLADGFPGVADFDADGDPEIVVVVAGGVRLQDHTGAVIWGPNDIAGNGRGGPPTIADYDGDGLPEIGVANSGFYTVLDTDGSLLWSNPTSDASSGMTGSSVFDFNGDGVAEVVYADEVDLFVYQGTDGAVLLQEPNHTSRTQLEYPVIADIDGDDFAEIVLPGNDFFTAGWTGVTVLGNVSGRGWWKARRIWNQHAYFATHVDDDGGIPANQGKPWLVHNSFRQTFPPDAWLGYPTPNLVPEAIGPCEGPDGPRFGVRVANEGAADTGAAPTVTLTQGGQVVAEGNTDAPIPAGMTSDVVWFDLDDAPEGATWEVTVDGAGVIVECDETDNVAVWP